MMKPAAVTRSMEDISGGIDAIDAPSATLRSGPIVSVTGAIAPYTHRLYEALGNRIEGPLHVLTCVDIEPQRKWQVAAPQSYRLEVMSGFRVHRSDTRHIYLNTSVVSHLARIRPRAIIVHDFSPTMMIAAGYARLTRTPYAIATDGSRAADPGHASLIHAWSRRLVVPGAKIGLGASEDSLALLQDWGMPADRGLLAPIPAAWDAPDFVPGYEERPFDVMFCGAIEDQRKGVGFLTDALLAAKSRGQTLSCRFVGEGPLKAEIAARLAAANIPARFDGCLQQPEIRSAYCSARLLAFPTRSDCWGLVANEAILCGTPVVSSPHAVSAIELVDRHRAGIVRDLDPESWADALISASRNRTRWQAMHDACLPATRAFSIERATSAMELAIRALID